MVGGATWLDAAGHSQEFSRKVNRKLTRLGNDYTLRHGGVEL
jgi:hypothetical protein